MYQAQYQRFPATHGEHSPPLTANGEFAALLNTLMGDFTKVHVLQVVEGKLKSSSPLVRFDSDLYFSVTLLASSSLAQLLVVLKRRANIVVKEGGHVSF
jgi:hypothetical protein